MGDVIPLPKANLGNGAREALIRILDAECDLYPPSTETTLKLPDRLLIGLWIEGFKVVPLTGNEE